MRKSGRAKIDAMLRHLACGQAPEDFPATTYERLRLIERAGGRGLIEWQKERGRYELTPIGWRQLTPRRSLGLPSLMVSMTIGAAIGAAALAVLWLPADALHRSSGPVAASVSRVEEPTAVPAARSGDAAMRSPAPETPAVAEQPAPKQPAAEAAPTEKQVKKTHRRAGYRPRRGQTGSSWGFADPSRGRQSRYTNSRDSWFAFR